MKKYANFDIFPPKSMKKYAIFFRKKYEIKENSDKKVCP